MRFPPCLDILKKSPMYNGNVRSYFDLNQCAVLAISNSKSIFFFSVIQNGKCRYYHITSNNSEIDKIFGNKQTYILGGVDIPFETEEFRMFCDELFNATINSNYFEDVVLSIERRSNKIEVFFTFEGIYRSIEYKAESKSLTECLLYEYFNRISSLDYYAKFSYNTSVGFSVRGAPLSIKQFFEKYFMNVFGDFKSTTMATNEIWDAYYDWGRRISKLTEDLETSNPEFLIFSDIIPLKFDLCRRIEFALRR